MCVSFLHCIPSIPGTIRIISAIFSLERLQTERIDFPHHNYFHSRTFPLLCQVLGNGWWWWWSLHAGALLSY